MDGIKCVEKWPRKVPHVWVKALNYYLNCWVPCFGAFDQSKLDKIHEGFMSTLFSVCSVFCFAWKKWLLVSYFFLISISEWLNKETTDGTGKHPWHRGCWSANNLWGCKNKGFLGTVRCYLMDKDFSGGIKNCQTEEYLPCDWQIHLVEQCITPRNIHFKVKT